MQENVPFHQSPTQVMSEEEEKETVKTEVSRLVERKAAHQNKNLSEELKQGLQVPALSLPLTKLGEERLASPSHRM